MGQYDEIGKQLSALGKKSEVVPARTEQVASTVSHAPSETHYKGADNNNHNELYNRPNVSHDEALRKDRAQLTARSSDAYRNYPIITGSVLQERAAQVGVKFQLDWQPFHDSFEWAGDEEREMEIEGIAEDLWDMEMESSAHWIDSNGQLNVSQLAAQAAFMGALHGEALGVFQWSNKPSYRPHPIKVLMKDPACLRTPYDLNSKIYEKFKVYHGIISGKKSSGLRSYCIHNLPPDDPEAYIQLYGSEPSKRDWFMVPERFRSQADREEYPDQAVPGAWLVAHVGDFARMPGATRPEPPMMSMLTLLRASSKWKDAHLDAAWLSSLFASVIESETPHQLASHFGGIPNAGGGDQEPQKEWQQYADDRETYHAKVRHEIMGNTNVLGLYPGEKLSHLNGGHPISNYGPFNKSILEELARGSGQGYAEFTGDFSQQNFSASQMAEINTWRRRLPQVRAVPGAFCQKIFFNWLQHKIIKGEFDFFKAGRGPRQRADWFLNNQDKITRCEFSGPKRQPNDIGKLYKAIAVGHKLGIVDLESASKDISELRYRTLQKRVKRDKILQATLEKELADIANGNSPKGKSNVAAG